MQSSDAAPQQSTVFTSEAGTMMSEAVRASSAEITAPPEAVWLAVQKVYKDLDIPLTVDNPAAHQLGNNDFFKTRQIGGERMSSYIDCGSGVTGPKADTWRIVMSLLTDVLPTANGTTLKVTFKASGKDMTAGSSFLVPCGNNGRLESSVIARVKAALGKT